MLKRCSPVFGGGSVVVDSLLIVTPIVGFCNCSMFCCVIICVHSSFALVSMGKRELAALIFSSSWCLMINVCFFLTMPWVCLQFVIVIFPDHTHLLITMLKRCYPRPSTLKPHYHVAVL